MRKVAYAAGPVFPSRVRPAPSPSEQQVRIDWENTQPIQCFSGLGASAQDHRIHRGKRRPA